MRLIGIFGGTFDPVHHAHLRCAIELKEQLELSQVRMIPCHRPPHRAQPETSSKHRLAMLKLAVKNVSGLYVDDRELARNSYSYTVDTLRSLRVSLGGSRLVLFMGMDAFSAFCSWHEWQAILQMADIVVTKRPGFSVSESAAKLLEQRGVDSLQQSGDRIGRILLSELTQLSISSTKIRKTLANGQDAHFLLPENVLQYIDKKALYRTLQ